MARRSRKRKVLLVLATIVVAIVVIIVALPLWLPWTLKPAFGKYGVQFGSYDRQGYQRLALSDVHYKKGNTTFTAKRAELFQPTAWVWKKQFGATETPFVEVRDWKLTIDASDPSKKRKKVSLATILDQLDAALPQISAWLRTASLANGEIRFREEVIRVPMLTWDRGLLQATASSEKRKESARIEGWFSTEPKRLRAKLEQADVSLDVDLRRNESTAQVDGLAFWHTNKINFMMAMPTEGWWPTEARLKSENLRVPAHLLKLPQYQDLVGNVEGKWNGKEFSLDLSAQAKPQREKWPALTAEIHASGTTNVARIEQFSLKAPWLTAELSKNIEVDFSGKLLSPEALLKVTADLSEQNYFKARGKFAGEARLRRSEKKFPQASFLLQATEFDGFDIHARQVSLAASFDWPLLEIQSVKANLAEGGMAQASGKVDFAQKQIISSRVALSGDFGKRFLPPQLSYTEVALTAQASGPMKMPAHSGTLEIKNLVVPHLTPLTVAADWRGKHLDFDQLQVNTTARRSSLTLAAAGKLTTENADLSLKTLTLTKLGQPFLTLQQPANISARKLPGEKPTWQVALEKLQWQGGERAVALAGNLKGPTEGKITGSVKQLNSVVFQDFFTNRLPNIKLNSLEFLGGWTNGPLDFVLRGQGEYRADEANIFAAKITAAGDASGLSFEHLDVMSESVPVLSGRGFIPIVIHPHRKEKLEVRPRQLVDFRADTQPNKVFWDRIAELIHFRFEAPELHMIVTGSLDRPRGNIVARATKAEWLVKNPKRMVPKIEKLDAEIEMNEEVVRLKRFSLLVEGEPVSVEAELPLGDIPSTKIAHNAARKPASEGRKTAVKEPAGAAKKEESDHERWAFSPQNWKKMFDWRKARGRIFARDIEFAPFVRYAPKFLAPQGNASLNVAFNPGLQFDGTLRITNASTRPLPGSGPLHDVEADIRFVGRRIELTDVHGYLGGQPIGIFGHIDFAKMQDALPLIDLKLLGQNVPLTRQPDVVVRGDMNLKISNQRSGGLLPVASKDSGKTARAMKQANSSSANLPTISGEVQLRDSFYLGDLKQMLPGRVTSAKKRPPYFSVEAEQIGDWRLDVKVTGNEFMKLRTPVFRGAVSANMKLNGTLREPLALGDATIDSGTLQFPFANFEVTQGFVSLTSDNPYRPGIFVTATSRAFGYDLQMNLNGPADQPIIEFTSTPTLTSEQIILMVTTGEVPKKAFEYSQQQKAQKLAMFLGKSFISKFSSDEGGAERLSITTGEEISEKGRETYSLEYKLTDKWSIVGEYDRFGALNAGFKWRVYSK